MAQNIYDNDSFFKEYSKLDRSQKGLDGAPEWPRLRGMVGDVRGLDVLDLGCGFGWFCRWAGREGGARQVRGVDLSDNMLTRAREAGWGADTGIIYERADLDTIELPGASLDLVYSSLTLHYLSDLDRLFGEISRALRSRGRLVFSVEHPIFTAPTCPEPSWQTVEEHRVWPLHGYANEGVRTTNWLADGVRKCHRTIQTYLSLLWKNGFSLEDFEEWMPSDEDLKAHPDWTGARERPIFLLILAQKKE